MCICNKCFHSREKTGRGESLAEQWCFERVSGGICGLHCRKKQGGGKPGKTTTTLGGGGDPIQGKRVF